MNKKLLLSIAGIEFKIYSNHFLLPEEDLNRSARRQFFSEKPADDAKNHIDVKLTRRPVPEISNLEKQFESEKSWVIYSHEDDYVITSATSLSDPPAWTAHYQLKYNRITVYCGNRLFHLKQNRLIMNPISYPLDQIIVMLFLAEHCGGIFHAAGWIKNNGACMFAGKSGAGKSTISKLINKITGDTPISDDRVAVRKLGQTLTAFGTPWPGDAGYAINTSAPLKAMFFLEKGAENRIIQLNTKDAISHLMPVASILWYDKGKVEKMMSFCEDLIMSIPMFRLTFSADGEVVKMLNEFIKNAV